MIYWNPPACLPRSCPPGLAEVFTASVAAQPGRLLQGRLLLKGSGFGPWLRALLVRSNDVLLGAALCEVSWWAACGSGGRAGDLVAGRFASSILGCRGVPEQDHLTLTAPDEPAVALRG